MSETIQPRHNGIRKQLLATASAFALFAVCGAQSAQADDGADRSLVWLELGGQWNQIGGQNEVFAPPFLATTPFPKGLPGNLQPPIDSGIAEDAKITFQPDGSDWVISAAARYGRTGRNVHEHEQPAAYCNAYGSCRGPFSVSDGSMHTSERDEVLDFQVGKDVGLGLFGHKGSSVFSAGLRYASFDLKSNLQLTSHPTNVHQHGHYFHETADVARRFTGLGPSVSWDASAPFAGETDTGSLSLDWGANAALLFGRQSASGRHETKNISYFYYSNTVIYDNPNMIARKRGTVVTNLGGFAAASFQLKDFKVNLGYRADFFLGAMDGGIDTAQKENRGFYGPFANVSVGFP